MMNTCDRVVSETLYANCLQTFHVLCVL